MIAETIAEAPGYGFSVKQDAPFAWASVKEKRDAYITRLNGIYTTNMSKDSIQQIVGTAQFVDSKTVRVNDETYSAKVNILASLTLSAYFDCNWIRSVDSGCSGRSKVWNH